MTTYTLILLGVVQHVVEAVHSERYDNFNLTPKGLAGSCVVEAVHSERYDNIGSRVGVDCNRSCRSRSFGAV